LKEKEEPKKLWPARKRREGERRNTRFNTETVPDGGDFARRNGLKRHLA